MYTRCLHLAYVLGCLLVGVNAAQAQSVIVQYFNAAGSPVGSDTYAPNESFSVAIDNVIASVKIITTSSTVDIGEMTVEPSQFDAGQPVWIYVTPDAIPGSGFPAASSGRDWAGINDFRGNIFFKGRIGRDLTGDISVDNLQSFWAAGEILDSVIAIEGPFFLRASQIGSNANVTSQSGDIALVDVLNGYLRGDVRAPKGHIGTINVPNGDIGEFILGQPLVFVPIEIEAGAEGSSGFHIGTIHASGDMSANIDTGDGTVNSFFVGGHLGGNNVDGTFNLGDFNEFQVNGNFYS